MKIISYCIHSFAKTKIGGNPAGVVPNADSLSEAEMKKIAAILGFSETAFVMKSNCADFKVRFFTPKEEVNLCGHATIGTYFTLASLGYIKPGKYLQETKAGVFGVEIKKGNSILMNQATPSFYDYIGKEEIADSLNLLADEIADDLPIQIVSTGLKDIIIPIKNLTRLNSIQPNFKKIEAISKKQKVIGYHVFTLESLSGATAHCRNFAPLYDIPEESATGTSNGALACYLFHYGKIDASRAKHLTFEQGYSMNKPSEIIVSLELQANQICSVKVGGQAMNLTSKEIEL